MTSVQPAKSSSSEVAQWDGETGLEDFDSSDISMPRLQIDHDEGVFRDSQTSDTFAELNVIILGLHKGRLMWGELSDGDKQDAPLCKSPNFKDGFPNMDPDVGRDKNFPWSKQNVFTPDDAKPIQLDDGRLTAPSIPCASCFFKTWGSDPTGKKPWCSDEWTLPLLYQDADDMWSPALFSVRRSGIKPAKNYLTPFSTRKIPTFKAVTKLSLQSAKRGKVEYSVPVFTKIGSTDERDWQDYLDNFKSAKAFLSQWPMPATQEEVEEESGVIVNNDFTPEAELKTEVKKPEPEPEPEVVEKPVAEEEKVFRTSGRIKAPSKPAQTAGTVIIDDDEEPPF